MKRQSENVFYSLCWLADCRGGLLKIDQWLTVKEDSKISSNELTSLLEDDEGKNSRKMCAAQKSIITNNYFLSNLDQLIHNVKMKYRINTSIKNAPV